LEFVVTLRPTVLRFPGGLCADAYFWEDGIGPHNFRPEPRPSQLEAFAGDCGKQGFDYGTDEHMALCEQIGAEAFITINYGSGLVGDSVSTRAPLSQRIQRAADWVEYLNVPNDGSNPNGGVNWAAQRAENGHPEPYGVKYWEIGNEINLKAQFGHTDVETYAQDVVAFAQNMKAVDPSIKIGAVGSNHPHWHTWWNLSPLEWNATLLQIAHRVIDFLVVHCHYPGPTSVSGEDLYRAGLAGANQVFFDLKEIRRIIDQEADSSIGIVPGENAFFGGVEWHWELSTTSLLSGLHFADLLMLFLEQSSALNIDFACGWTLHSKALGGDIACTWGQEQRYVRPEYYAQQIFREHFGDILVANSTNCNTFATVEVGEIPARSAVPELSVCASIDSARTKLYLMVLNRQLEQDVATTVQVAGFEPQSEARIFTLNGPSITANNEDDPNTVTIVPSTCAPVSSSFTYTFPGHSLTAIELRRSEESTPPTISEVNITDITGQSAKVTWHTDKPSDSKIEYGPAPGDYLLAVEDPLLTTQHQLCLEPLQSETIYYIRVGSCDSQGNMALSWEDTLWTPDVTPPQISQVEVVAITETTATICWMTDEPADAHVEYRAADGLLQTLMDSSLTDEHLISLGGLQAATEYTFWVSSVDSVENLSDQVEGFFTTTSPRSGADESGCSDPLPSNYKLWQNFPNPFNGSTNIRYHLPQGGPVEVKIYNPMGQLVKTLVEENQPPGEYQVSWDVRDGWGDEVASGVYLCCLLAGDFRETCKMTLLR
jgi:alpha-L-arabinofuranosidase